MASGKWILNFENAWYFDAIYMYLFQFINYKL